MRENGSQLRHAATGVLDDALSPFSQEASPHAVPRSANDMGGTLKDMPQKGNWRLLPWTDLGAKDNF